VLVKVTVLQKTEVAKCNWLGQLFICTLFYHPVKSQNLKFENSTNNKCQMFETSGLYQHQSLIIFNELNFIKIKEVIRKVGDLWIISYQDNFMEKSTCS